MVIPDALRVLRLQHGHKYCKLGDLSSAVRCRSRGVGGWCWAAWGQAARARSGRWGTAWQVWRPLKCENGVQKEPRCTLPQVGWRHQATVAELEEKRKAKVRSAAQHSRAGHSTHHSPV